MAINLITTCQAVGGGTNPVTGLGEDTQLTIGGTWATNDTFTVQLTLGSNGYQDQVGAGNVTGVALSYVLTFGNKVFGLSGSTLYGSAIGGPTVWNNPNALGNGFINMSNWYSTNENLVAAAPYQGRLAIFSRKTAQIWIVDPNFANWQQQQILTNIGTLAPLSVQSLGDLDVLFLSDTGVRSLRVRDMSLNAFVNDIGSPIDSLIQTALLSGNGPTACGIVEPTANRYWLYLNGLIYVLSYFPSVKIQAWSTYAPTWANDLAASGTHYPGGPGGTLTAVTYAAVIGRTYFWNRNSAFSITDGVNTYLSPQSFVAKGMMLTELGNQGTLVTSVLEEQTPFTPQKFLIFGGQVYCRDANNFYLYGGTNNNTYDGCIMSGTTSWMDAKKPVVRKQSKGFDAAFQGAFSFQMGMDQASETLDQVAAPASSTFQHGSYTYSTDGFHIRFGFNTTDNQYARLSSLIYRYQEGDEK